MFTKSKKIQVYSENHATNNGANHKIQLKNSFFDFREIAKTWTLNVSVNKKVTSFYLKDSFLFPLTEIFFDFCTIAKTLNVSVNVKAK